MLHSNIKRVIFIIICLVLLNMEDTSQKEAQQKLLSSSTQVINDTEYVGSVGSFSDTSDITTKDSTYSHRVKHRQQNRIKKYPKTRPLRTALKIMSKIR